MVAEGDKLSLPRNIGFTVAFPEENADERFAGHFRERGSAVSVEFAETVKALPWDVIVVRHMFPSRQEMGDSETTLQEVADALRAFSQML